MQEGGEGEEEEEKGDKDKKVMLLYDEWWLRVRIKVNYALRRGVRSVDDSGVLRQMSYLQMGH